MSAPVTVIVPVKSTAVGKSRLQLPAALRQQVARAMAMDTITAVAQVAAVLAVVEDEQDGILLGALAGVRVHRTAVRGLNEAILDGVRTLGHPAHRVAVLPADLPGLSAVDLTQALDESAELPFAVVADRQGDGTTLLSAGRAEWLRPRYGVDSFRRHLAAGAVALSTPAHSSLRRDVDQPDDLAGALGPLTRQALVVDDHSAGLPRVSSATC